MRKNTKKIENLKIGATLIELIIYSALLIFISIFAINSVLVINSALVKIRLNRRININGEQVMQKLFREIRFAKDINASSTFGVNPGDISLKTFVSPTDSTEIDADFYISGGRLMFKKGAAAPLILTEPNIAITNFLFQQITASSTSKAIKIELGLGTGNQKFAASSTFYGTAILRGSY